MKKCFFLIALATLFLLGSCRTRATEVNVEGPSRISSLVSEYSLMPDFEVVRLGRLGLGLVRTVLRHNMDEDEMQVLDLIRGVRKVIIANYEDCDERVRTEFTSRLAKYLDKDCLLLEAKDSGEKVEIYGETSGSGDRITNLIINAPSDGALICIYGTIPTGSLSKIVNQ